MSYYTEIQCGAYAMRVARQGGQLIALEKNGVAIVNAPESEEALLDKPTRYGLPILFPPNRIDGGTFEAAGQRYAFVVNEEARGNSLHGFLHTRVWEELQSKENEVVVRFTCREDTDFYRYYPHAFVAEQSYRLSEEGLFHTVTIQNQGNRPMPIGLGYHTAFVIEDDSKVWLSVGERIGMSERMLPTGEVRALTPQEAQLRENGLDPHAWSMDDHYTAKPLEKEGRSFHGAVIQRRLGTVVYEVDAFYRHWMVWNAGGNTDFICLEPQNWRVNAPNLMQQGMSEEEAGFCLLAPGQSLRVVSRIYMQ